MSTYELGFRKNWCQPLVDRVMTDSTDLTVQAQTWLYWLKLGLVTSELGPWTVLASCGKNGGGGLVASLGDMWGSWSDIVFDGSDRSWLVARSPSYSSRGPWYVTLDCLDGTTYYKGYVYFSKHQPDLSSLSLGARPIATGAEWSHGPVVLHNNQASARAGHRCQLFQADDGSFVFAASIADGSNCLGSVLMFNVLATRGLKSWDTVGAASLQYASQLAQLTSRSDIAFASLHEDGTQALLRPVTLYVPTGVGAAENDVPMAFLHTSLIDNAWSGHPIMLYSCNSNQQCFRGWLEDLTWHPNQIEDGRPAFGSGVQRAVAVGPFWVPAAIPIFVP